MSMDIVDTAVAAGSFATLVEAIKTADLVDTLKGKGPLTVFARTDAAFAKLPAGAVEDLINDKAKLLKFLPTTFCLVRWIRTRSCKNRT